MKLALHRLGQSQWETALNDAANVKQSFLTGLEHLAQAFMRRLLADAEPRVWQTTDANSNRWWNAHDPATGRSLYSASEAEMRAWIEQRYYPIKG